MRKHTFDTKGYTIDTKSRGQNLRFHFLIETDIFGQFRPQKCAADKEKALSHSSTFTRCIPKTAQAKGLFETEIKEKNLKVSINLEVLIWRTFRDSNHVRLQHQFNIAAQNDGSFYCVAAQLSALP